MTLLLAAILPTLAASAAVPEGAVKLPVPRVDYRPNEASATRSPWIDANGWRILRVPGKRYFYNVPANAAALAAAESFAYQANAAIYTTKAGEAVFNRMLDFLRSVPEADLPAMANIGVIDDGSNETSELMNLLARHNLLYKIVPAPDPRLHVNVKPEAGDPTLRTVTIRGQVGDDNRLLRLYGSETVIARLVGNGSRARLHILNYAPQPVPGLRIRILGAWAKQTLLCFGKPGLRLADIAVDATATEFTVPEISTYAIIDLAH